MAKILESAALTATKTRVKPRTVLAVVSVVAVSAAIAVGIGIFGGGFPAVVTTTKTCVDPNETFNKDVPLAIVSKNPLYFNPDIKSKAYQKPYGSYYQDVCLIDVAITLADGRKAWKSTPVNDCSVADEDGVTKRFCRLQEGFCTGANVSNYFFKCPNGCNSGHCNLVVDKLYDKVVKSASFPEVLYYVGYDLRIAGYGRFTFPRALPLYPDYNTFDSWYPNQDNVLSLSNEELIKYPIRGNVTYRPGTKLLKISTDPKVYAVEPGGVLRNMGTASTSNYLAGIYGSNWNDRVVIVPDSFFGNYTIGLDWTAANKHPDGTLIQYSGSGDIYLIKNGQKRKFTGAGFTDNRYRIENVVTDVNPNDFIYPDGQPISAGEKELINVAGYLPPN